MIRVVHPGIPDPWVKKAPDPGSMSQKGTGSRIHESKRHRIPDPCVKKAPDPGSMSQKGTGSRIHESKRHRIPDPCVIKAPDPGSATLVIGLPEDREGIDGLLMGVAGVVLAVH
jgi:hypothetical protein